MKSVLNFVLFFTGALYWAQSGNVGINTASPKATLDINGNVKIRTVESLDSLAVNQTLLVLDETSSGDFELKKISADYFRNGLLKNETMYSARKSSNISILDLSLYEGYQAIKFEDSDRVVGDASAGLFFTTSGDSYYLVPSDGVYSISFAFTYGTGVQASLLGGTPSIGILRQLNGTSGSGSYTVLDKFEFSGINLAYLINLSLSQGSLNGIYNLKKGDKIYFAINKGGISLDLLNSSKSSFSIYKISELL